MLASYQQTMLNEESKHCRIISIYSLFWPANYNQVLPLLKVLQVGWLLSISVLSNRVLISGCQRLSKFSRMEAGCWLVTGIVSHFSLFAQIKGRSLEHWATAEHLRWQTTKLSYEQNMLSGERAQLTSFGHKAWKKHSTWTKVSNTNEEDLQEWIAKKVKCNLTQVWISI